VTTGVLVVGGGIGGLTAALCSARAGLTVRVLEQAAAFGEIGAGIQLAPNATRVLDRLGLLDRVRAVGVLPRRLVLADAVTTRELTHLPLSDFPTRYGGPYVVMHRSDLLTILLEACREAGVALETGARVASIEEAGEQVEARCEDGRVFTGRALLACDGLNSRVRSRFSDDEVRFSGYVAYRGAVPMAQVERHADLSDVVVWIGPAMHLVQYPLRSGEMYNQVAVFRSAAWERGEADWGTPEELDAVFSPASEHVRESTRLLGRDHRWPMFDREPIDTWVQGRIALLGDAAHPMLQYLAQGACQAIEDADCAAGLLAEGAPEKALLRYQQQRAPRTARVQRTARTWGDIWHVDGVGAMLRNALLDQRAPDDHTHVAWLYGTQDAS
jgi:salicylate hydroxylase